MTSLPKHGYVVEGSIEAAHADGCNLLRFTVGGDRALPDVGDTIHVRDLELTESWGNVVEVKGRAVTFSPAAAVTMERAR